MQDWLTKQTAAGVALGIATTLLATYTYNKLSKKDHPSKKHK